MAQLTPLDEVQGFVLGRIMPAPPVELSLGDALGLVLASDVVAPEPVPPFANSAMDGYAVRKEDCAHADPDGPVQLRVVGEVPAGRPPEHRVGIGEAVRIMTGAAVPDGADGIVIVEHTERVSSGDGTEHVTVRRPAGDHIRPAGGDIEAGATVFSAGSELGPAHIGVLASLGLTSVAVFRRPRVGVLSTGDELVPPGRPLEPGQIRESNRPMLLALARRDGFDPVDLGVAPDDEQVIAAALEEGLSHCDAVLTSGGVSVGDYDFVRTVLDRMADMRWFQVAIKPAKPFAFGIADGVPVFGLPGNPVSSFVSYELFARPAIRRWMGQPQPFRPRLPAVAGEDMDRRPDGKIHFDRVRVHHDGAGLVAVRSGGQASNVLSAMAHANALAVLPDGEGVRSGDPLEVIPLEVPPGLPSTLGP